MKKARNDQFFSNLEKFVNKVYPNQPQRQPYLNLKSWPSPRDEAWKFSRLGKLARKNILPMNLENQQNMNINKLIKDSISLVFVNGKFEKKLSDKLLSEIVIEEVQIEDFKEIINKFDNLSVKNHPTLNSTLSCSQKFFKIKFKNDIKFYKPIEIFNLGGTENTSIHPFIFIDLEKNVDVQVFQHYSTYAGLLAPFEIINLSENSNLEIIKIYDDKINSHNLSLTLSVIKEEANLRSFALIKGGEFTRSEMHTLLVGENSKADINGIYLSSGNQHHDITSCVYHNVPNCKSSQIVKGVLGEESTAVFQGKVRVEKLAQKTEAKQMSRAIMLSDKAVSNSKPELEIYADDVICGHGATVGELDEDQIFYLSSRGVSKQKAKVILIDAFLNEMISLSISDKFHDIIYNETKTKINKLLANEYE